MLQRSVGLGVCLCVAVAWGSEAEEKPEKAESRPGHVYEMAVIRAVEGMRVMAARNPDCWFVSPKSARNVVGWETRTEIRRYREQRQKVPIYAYETYEALVPGERTGQLVKDTRRRITGIIGYRVVNQRILDPGGPIERPHAMRLPIYEPGSAPVWGWGELGANALAVYALRVVGVPGSDDLIRPTADGLAAGVNAFDMPDATWDLAWMTAAFATLPGQSFQDLTERCAAKLMDGQVATGECKGLWGPVCVDPALLASVCKVIFALSEEQVEVAAKVEAEMQAGQARGSGKRRLSRAEEEKNRIDHALVALHREGGRVSQVGLRLFEALGGSVTLAAPDGSRARVCGHPYLIHNQTVADMESTAVALFALRVAAQHNRLPQRTWRPTLDVAGRAAVARAGIPLARLATDVIRLAAQAVAGARQSDGRWHETNRHQSCGAFDWLKSVPPVKGRFSALASPVSAVTTLRGLAAFTSATALRNGTPSAVPYANPAFMKIHHEATAWIWPVRGEADARDFAQRLFTTGLLSGAVPGMPRQPPPDGWHQTARRVLETQSKTSGLWGHKTRQVVWSSTGIWARKAALPEIPADRMRAFYPLPHLEPSLTQPLEAGRIRAHPHSISEWSVETAGALLLLSHGLGDDWICPTEGVAYEATESDD